jgi:DNA-binding NtrC family response regulator
MTKQIELKTGDREYFRNLTEFAFRNPYEKESLLLAYRVAGGKYPAGDQLRGKVYETIKKRIEKVTAHGQLNWKQFSGEDRYLVRHALMHDSYYRCFSKFDDLILRQIEEDLSDHPLPFAEETLSLMRSRGFSIKDSLQYFGLFYQLRRAWYFINHALIGQSRSMQTLRSHLWRSLFTSFPAVYEKALWDRMEDFSTFLVGETGTGKGTAAKAIGRSGFIPFNEKKLNFSENFRHNLIEINLSQFPESLIESELFGHKKGAFTGAVDDHDGIFALCSPHGSIFLDEIGDVSVPIQIKLLKVLEERRFSPVGGHNTLQFNGRIITATNKSLMKLEQKKTFREDFYYRLCSNIIIVPTLRQQLYEDPTTLETLLEHTILRIAGEPIPQLLEVVMTTLEKEVGLDYEWPGNVRELEQAVRSILLTLHYNKNNSGRVDVVHQLYHAIEKEAVDAQELVSIYCLILYRKYGTYEKVAKITKLDPRTVKKHIQTQTERKSPPRQPRRSG